MRLGLFIANQGTWAISHAAPQQQPSWYRTKQAALAAENYGFDFLFASLNVRGFGGPLQVWENTLEPMAIIAALAECTQRIKLYGTAAILLTHPGMLAKQITAISNIADGRFGINIVSGWEKDAYAQMGLWPGDSHVQDRYDRASEYVIVLRELLEKGYSNFKGEYFQIEDFRFGPPPKAPVDVVCAGQSDRGIRFAAEHGDAQFVFGKKTPEAQRDLNAKVAAAAAKTGRDVGVISQYTIIQRDSVAEAEETVARWREHAEPEAMATLRGHAAPQAGSTSITSDLGSADNFMFGVPQIVGDAKTVADQLNEFADVEGTSGLLLNFADELIDLERFGTQVMPLLR